MAVAMTEVTENRPIRTDGSRPTIGMWAEIMTFPAEMRLPDGAFILARPLLVEAERTDHGVLIHCKIADDDAFGATREEAIYDLLTSIVDRYHSLNRRAEQLSPRDREVLERLRTLLQPAQG